LKRPIAAALWNSSPVQLFDGRTNGCKEEGRKEVTLIDDCDNHSVQAGDGAADRKGEMKARSRG